MKDLKNMKKDKMMAKQKFNNNFNTFMIFMVNPFVNSMKDLEQHSREKAYKAQEE